MIRIGTLSVDDDTPEHIIRALVRRYAREGYLLDVVLLKPGELPKNKLDESVKA